MCSGFSLMFAFPLLNALGTLVLIPLKEEWSLILASAFTARMCASLHARGRRTGTFRAGDSVAF